MKKIFYVILLLIYTQAFGQSTKEELIKSAQNGNIKAMIELGHKHRFPHTKEGLVYFNKWHKNISQNHNPKEIYELAMIYKKYADMLINGDIVANKLLMLSGNLGSTSAKFALAKNFIKRYKYKDAERILTKEVAKELSQEQLQELYTLIARSSAKKIIATLALTIEKKGYEYPYMYYMLLGDRLRYDTNQTKKQNFINEVLSLKNPQTIYKVAEYAPDNDAVRLYEKVVQLDKDNSQGYMKLASKYRYLLGNKNKEEQDRFFELYTSNYEKALELGESKAGLNLLNAYYFDKASEEKYFDLVEKMKKNEKTAFVLARFLKQKDRKGEADVILEDLANKGSQRAIVELATYHKDYRFNPYTYRLETKWKEKVKNSQDKSLKLAYAKAVKEARRRDEETLIKEIADDILQKEKNKKLEIAQNEIKNTDDILTLRKIIKEYQYKPLAFEAMKKAAQFGDKKNILELAIRYLGKGQYEKALTLYENLANQNDLYALKRLGSFYAYPPIDKFKDLNRSIAYYERAANLGDIEALDKLAQAYTCGSCNNKENLDYKKAMMYHQKLVKKGEYASLIDIGNFYHYGLGVEKDLLKAKEYYEKALQKGQKNANYYLGLLYYNTYDNKNLIKKDYKQAFEYYKKAQTCSSFELGWFYWKGLGVKKDEKKAIEYFSFTAGHNSGAAYNMARIYDDRKDYKNAFKYYKISMGLGSASAINSLGILYQTGRGVKKDVNQALKYYKMAYEKGNRLAAYNIGLLYFDGDSGIKKDLKKAKFWFKKANDKKSLKMLKNIEKKLKKVKK